MSRAVAVPARMYVYNYRLFDRYNKEVVSVAVLGDDNPHWRPDSFGYIRWGFQAGIRFPVAKLLDYAGQTDWLEQHPNAFATVVLTHLKTLETRQDETQRYSWKTRLIKELYDRGMNADDVRRLFRFIDWIMDLPRALEKTFWDEVKQYEEEKHMPFMTTPERIGREEGLSQGLSQGLLKGIEAMLKYKFGQEGLRLMPEIRDIHELEKLEAILRAIETVASPEELRRMCIVSGHDSSGS